MKILVTGGAGFIGSHLIDLLLSKGHTVTCLDNLSTGSVENISSNLEGKRFDFVKGSILDEDLVNKLVRKKDIVFHLAAVLGVENVIKNPDLCIIVNSRGTENLLESSRKAKIKKFFLASTSEVYGSNGKMPLSEDSKRVLGDTKVSRWSYSTVKALDEHLTFAYYQKYSLPVIVSRYFNIYGPRSLNNVYKHVITKFILQAMKNKDITVYGKGEQKRSFLYVKDAAYATYELTFKKQGEIYNIGNPVSITIMKLARLIKRLAKSKSKIVHVDPKKEIGKGFEDTPIRIPDSNKLQKAINFSRVTSLEDGLKKTLAYFKEAV